MPKSSRSKSASARRRATSHSASRRGGDRSSSRTRVTSRPRATAKLARRSSATERRASRPRSSDRGAAIDRALRDLLIRQLEGGHAYAAFSDAVRDLPAELRGIKPNGAAHSPWQVLEHMRISQWDIVDFSRDPRHRSPAWPSGYWPEDPEPPDVKAWEASVREFERELAAMKKLISDPSRDLFKKIDHPEARAQHTLAREAMVLSEHNGYHTAEMIALRRLLGAWSRS